jgi:serine protease SohB
MEYFANYGLFLAKTLTFVIAILVIFGVIAAITSKMKDKEHAKLVVTPLNEKYEDLANILKQTIGNKFTLKKEKKAKKAAKKNKKIALDKKNPRIFVLNFQGDLRASTAQNLAEEVSAILLTAEPEDHVLLRLESPGGMVNAYGLAASQLQRLRNAKIKIVTAIDKVAASGGYMMACVADKIIAAPFSIVGSIGVIAQIPNFNRLLKKSNIDFEQITAGQYKRTLTLFGKNTDEDREKMQDEVNEIHELFKTFIKEHRSQVDIEQIATGEHWLATKALELKLVDDLKTSDDYLIEHMKDHDLYEVQYRIKKPLTKRLTIGLQNLIHDCLRIF